MASQHAVGGGLRWKSRPQVRPFVIPDVDGHARVAPTDNPGRRSFAGRVEDAFVRAGYIPDHNGVQAVRGDGAVVHVGDCEGDSDHRGAVANSEEPSFTGSIQPAPPSSSGALTEYEHLLEAQQRWRHAVLDEVDPSTDGGHGLSPPVYPFFESSVQWEPRSVFDPHDRGTSADYAARYRARQRREIGVRTGGEGMRAHHDHTPTWGGATQGMPVPPPPSDPRYAQHAPPRDGDASADGGGHRFYSGPGVPTYMPEGGRDFRSGPGPRITSRGPHDPGFAGPWLDKLGGQRCGGTYAMPNGVTKRGLLPR